MIDDLPKNIQDALNLGDFEVTENGGISSTKPLTGYRISCVLNELKKEYSMLLSAPDPLLSSAFNTLNLLKNSNRISPNVKLTKKINSLKVKQESDCSTDEKRLLTLDKKISENNQELENLLKDLAVMKSNRNLKNHISLLEHYIDQVIELCKECHKTYSMPKETQNKISELIEQASKLSSELHNDNNDKIKFHWGEKECTPFEMISKILVEVITKCEDNKARIRQINAPSHSSSTMVTSFDVEALDKQAEKTLVNSQTTLTAKKTSQNSETTLTWENIESSLEIFFIDELEDWLLTLKEKAIRLVQKEESFKPEDIEITEKKYKEFSDKIVKELEQMEEVKLGKDENDKVIHWRGILKLKNQRTEIDDQIINLKKQIEENDTTIENLKQKTKQLEDETDLILARQGKTITYQRNINEINNLEIQSRQIKDAKKKLADEIRNKEKDLNDLNLELAPSELFLEPIIKQLDTIETGLKAGKDVLPSLTAQS